MDEADNKSIKDVVDEAEKQISLNNTFYLIKISSLMRNMIVLKLEGQLLATAVESTQLLLDMDALERELILGSRELKKIIPSKERAAVFFYEAGNITEEEIGTLDEGDPFSSKLELVSEALRIVYGAPTLKNIMRKD